MEGALGSMAPQDTSYATRVLTEWTTRSIIVIIIVSSSSGSSSTVTQGNLGLWLRDITSTIAQYRQTYIIATASTTTTTTSNRSSGG